MVSAVDVPATTRRRHQPSTCTVTPDGRLVPWLASSGPLAYHPEAPPGRDYYFKYGWVLPGVLSEHARRRRPYLFGAQRIDEVAELFAFWRRAREGRLDPVTCRLATIDYDLVVAPLAVYRTFTRCGGPAYLFIQHGSYQIVEMADQNLLEAGEVLLYRGVQESTEFRHVQLTDLEGAKRETLRRYLAVQAHLLSDATRSFNSIHDRAKRAETGHIRDRSWMTDDLGRLYGLDVDRPGFARALWQNVHQSFALVRWVAERKFGPHYVTCKTPLDNIRITSFFAGEHEARIIDPRRVEIVEARGCRVVQVSC
jgi:hypothetical protein